jgi:hypothetical protein
MTLGAILNDTVSGFATLLTNHGDLLGGLL